MYKIINKNITQFIISKIYLSSYYAIVTVLMAISTPAAEISRFVFVYEENINGGHAQGCRI